MEDTYVSYDLGKKSTYITTYIGKACVVTALNIIIIIIMFNITRNNAYIRETIGSVLLFMHIGCVLPSIHNSIQ